MKTMTDIETAIEITQRQIEELKSNLPTLVTQEYYDSFNLAIEVKQKAIQALQEKAERDKGCEYCDSIELQNSSGRVFYKELPHHTEIITTLDDAHLQIAFDDKSGWVLHFEDENGDRMFDIKINDCPMCGRKLNNAPTDEH